MLVTNQGGVGYGHMSPDQAEAILERLEQRVDEAGGHLDAVYYCPNRKAFVPPQDHLNGRKPEPGMLYQAAVDCGEEIDLADVDRRPDVDLNTLSDKARAVGGGVLEAIMRWVGGWPTQ